jgi:hypothetical protein
VRRSASASGSKVITDPREAGSDLLELLLQRLYVFVGHARMVAVQTNELMRREHAKPAHAAR